MIKRFSFLTLAAVLALALSATAQAANVIVTDDSGGSSIDVTGTATGATGTTIAYKDTITGISRP